MSSTTPAAAPASDSKTKDSSAEESKLPAVSPRGGTSQGKRATTASGRKRSPRGARSTSPRRPGTSGSSRLPSTPYSPRRVTSPRRAGKIFAGGLQPHAPPEDREEDRGPGPGQYGTKVAFGTQAQSNRTTAAKFSFGTARRDAYSRQFLNPDLQKHMSNPATAGVDFIAPTGVGKMIESKKATAPSFSFGTAPRQQYLRSFISKGMQSRMPGRNTTNVDFIDADSSLGKKSNSKKASSASFSFGTQPRGAYERQYLSKGHQATMVRDTTATVDFIDKRSSFGGMQESRKGTAPSFGFGTSERGHRARIAPLKDLSPRA